MQAAQQTQPAARQRAPADLATLIGRHATTQGIQPTAIPSLYLFRSLTTSEPLHTFYEPSLCLVAQGSKAVALGSETFTYGPEHFLLVSVSLPISARILEASPERPHLALHINLDPTRIAALLMELETSGVPGPGAGRGLTVGALDPLLRDAATRLVQLLDTPSHIPVLAPLILREITYLLLVGPEGARLREIALMSGSTHRVARAIERLLREYDQPLRIADLARETGMSVSGLHHHFKTVTAMSPLQFQKQVRLQEARRLMLSEDIDAASASFRVGYASPSQFSREYRRLFGAPPSQDVARLRKSAQLQADQRPDPHVA